VATVGLDHDSHGFYAVCLGGDATHPWFVYRSKAPDADTRRIQICQEAWLFFASLPERSWIFAEEPLALQNGKTTRVLCLAAGALWAQTMGSGRGWIAPPGSGRSSAPALRPRRRLLIVCVSALGSRLVRVGSRRTSRLRTFLMLIVWQCTASGSDRGRRRDHQ
jgi:hypothetical protein